MLSDTLSEFAENESKKEYKFQRSHFFIWLTNAKYLKSVEKYRDKFGDSFYWIFFMIGRVCWSLGIKKKFNLQATDGKRTFVDEIFDKNCFALIDALGS